MTITREADYAMRIMALLSQTNNLIDANEIAQQCCVPYRFTLKILRKLVCAGLAKSYRGVNGGYLLNRPASEITLQDIIESIDGPMVINRCIAEPELCNNAGTCKLQKHLRASQEIFVEALVAKSLEEILAD